MRARTILTPMRTSDAVDLSETEPLTYWKQVLPQSAIQYNGRTIDFDRTYLADLIDAFHGQAVNQTMFQLATPVNGHGRDFDPERQRGEVTELALADDLPESVKSAMGEVKPGLYAKIRFFSKRAAKAVLDNPGLGVSARVRENFTKSDGSFVKRALVHVLGTIDPRVTGMSQWQAADLSYDQGDIDDDVLDLTAITYEGTTTMGNRKVTSDLSTLDLGDLSEDDLSELTDEELTALLAQLGDGEDGTDAGDHEDARELVGAGASLSNDASDLTDAIDLANTQAQVATQRANEALRRMAEAEWAEYRQRMVAAGVPPYELDLAEPVLNRPDAMVVDLSTSGEENIDVSAIVRELLESRKGTVDMSTEIGHEGQNTSGDAADDAVALAAWTAQFGD